MSLNNNNQQEVFKMGEQWFRMDEYDEEQCLCSVSYIQAILRNQDSYDETQFSVMRYGLSVDGQDAISVMIVPQNKTMMITEDKIIIQHGEGLGSVTTVLQDDTVEGAIAIDAIAEDFKDNWLQPPAPSARGPPLPALDNEVPPPYYN